MVSTLDTSSISPRTPKAAKVDENADKRTLVETRFPSCRLHCLVNIQRSALCNNTHAGKRILCFFNPMLLYEGFIQMKTLNMNDTINIFLH